MDVSPNESLQSATQNDGDDEHRASGRTIQGSPILPPTILELMPDAFLAGEQLQL